MKAEDKKSFILYSDLIHTVGKLPSKKAGELFLHILKYVNDQNPQTDDLIVNIAFEPIKQQLKRDLLKYENVKTKRSESGKLGGRPKKQKEAKKPNALIEKQKEAKKPNALIEKQTKAKKAVTVTDTDTDTDNDNVKKKRWVFVKPSLQEIKNYCEYRDNDINPAQFFNYYESNGWKVGKNSMKEWKAAIRNWENNAFNKKISNEDVGINLKIGKDFKYE